MNKLSICIDMGAKNNGFFVVKSFDNNIISKRATNIIIDNIMFSKKSRRENRHKDRNYKRRKLAKRFLKEFVNFKDYNEKNQEQILGLFNNRGYTFLSAQVEFECLNEETIKFKDKYFCHLKDLNTKKEFEEYLSNVNNFENEKELIKFLDENVKLINIEYKKKKSEIVKEFQTDFTKLIKPNLKMLKEFLENIQKEINTGSKPRINYFKEIKEEINKDFDFLKNFSKDEFFNLVGNISNLQLRVLRKFFNDNSLGDKYKILKNYFISHHYEEDDKSKRKELFIQLNKYSNIKDFLIKCNPNLTIPPYENMNNRNTYKCNSMFIKPEIITDDIKQVIDKLLNNSSFSNLLMENNEEVSEKKEFIKTQITTNNKKIKKDFSYSKYLQRIFDITSEKSSKELNPRNVFKHKATVNKGTISCVDCFKKKFGEKSYNILKPIAKKYYEQEEKILNGIYETTNSIFIKCNSNTPYKNNIKHTLLKPIYSYNFTLNEVDNFKENIENIKDLKTALKRLSDEAKKHQNSFYHIVEACYKKNEPIDDKDMRKIIKDLKDCSKKSTFFRLKEILVNKLGLKISFFKENDKINEKNLKRVINIFKQTYEILFKDINGFNKTCKYCTQENAIRSDENFTIGKRLLSDVAKPIDGMLDMMLDRLAHEITKNINSDDIKDIKTLEILMEQNKFEFEENLNTIKRKNNPKIKKFNKEKYKDDLNINICPYTGKYFEKGDFDHILPQSKGVYNSKANMIYCSVEGNQKIKGNRDYSLEMIDKKHLERIFGKNKGLDEIKEIIKKGIDSINIEEFTNFDNLNFDQQIALRYALFMRDTPIFQRAFDILKKDKIKTFSNGTQKRLAKFIYEKLVTKYPTKFKEIEVKSKVIHSQLVRATRNFLAKKNRDLEKKEIQNSHSHCVDAMLVFYLANCTLKGKVHKKKYTLGSMEPRFNFKNDIYIDESNINNLSKSKTFINSPKNEINSYKLFDDTIYSEKYKHIKKGDKNLATLIKNSFLYINKKGKKVFINDIKEIEEKSIYKIDVNKVSNAAYKFFNEKNAKELKNLKFLDDLRYCTSRKEIQDIFFDAKQTKLKEFSQIKNIPYYSQKLYRAIYKKLQLKKDLFITKDNKNILNIIELEDLLKNTFESKQENIYKKTRKRGKKRYKFTLPMVASPKFRIKRDNTWQVLGNKDISSKNYIINNEVKAIPFFSKNTIPLKISDLLECLLLDKNSKKIYEVCINTEKLSNWITHLKYFLSEAKRCTVEVTFVKSGFSDIDFSSIKVFDGAKDEIFKIFLERYINNEEKKLLYKYVGSIRDKLKGKATLLSDKKNTITLQYKANINSYKKQIILDNLNEASNS